VKPSFLAASLLALLGLTACLVADDPIDFTRPETPAKPAPKGLKFIDQGTNDPRLKGYKTPEGFKLEIVAEAPVVVNPAALAFATDGTPYVLESRSVTFKAAEETFTYKDGSSRKMLTLKKDIPDVVKVLRDSKGQGVYDESREILLDGFLTGIRLHDGYLYLSGRGIVRRCKQSKPGGDYDVKEVIAQGFSGLGRNQGSGLTIGPDGWLYVTCGDGDNYVEGSDGSRATVLRSGAVFRCRPDGSRMETFAIGFYNPNGNPAFDAAGNLFHVDQGGFVGKFVGCRLIHVAEECDSGWRRRVTAKHGVPDEARAAVFGERPGKVPPMAKTGQGLPGGLLIYNDTRLPEGYRGLLYYPDLLRRLIRAYRVEPEGSTFAVTEQFEFLTSDDPLFHPCQMVLGPDGALYVVDPRSDPALQAEREFRGIDVKQGRIYRVTWSGTKEVQALPRRGMDSWAKVVKLEDADLPDVLGSDEASYRLLAQHELVRRGNKNMAVLMKIMRSEDAPESAQVAALGVLQSFWNADVQDLFERVLASGTRDQRRLAAEVLGRNGTPGDKLQAGLLRALATEDPALKRAVALAMGRLASPGAADALVNTLAFDDGKDVYLRDGLIRAIESLGRPGLERLTTLADSGVSKELERVVEAFAACRIGPAVEFLPALLKNPHLSIEQRAALITSYNNYLLDPPLSLEPVLDYLLANPREAAAVKRAALAALPVGAFKGDKGTSCLVVLLDESFPNVQKETLRTLGATYGGARLVGRLFLDGKLPRSLLPQVTEVVGKFAREDEELGRMHKALLKARPTP